MCGIVGIVTRPDRRPDQATLKNMMDAIYHRGPDEEGQFIDDGVALGHRRLSIIDLSSGQQPMYTEDKQVCIVYNGEIYNFPEIRKELEALGYNFHTHCDTEVIMNAYHAWGEESVKRIRGMFAYAIHDKRAGKVFLARDRLGIKPLFYANVGDDALIFGSEHKALTVYPGLNRKIRPQSVEDYFSLGYVADPYTIYQDIHRLEPGHTLTVDLSTGSKKITQYWNVQFAPSYRGKFDDARDELSARIREAVKIRMVADVPLGAFLSGGVDSSAVVADMATIDDKPVNTCSIAFSDPRFNEIDYANEVAKQYKTNHWTREVDPNDYSLVDQLMDVYDEPYADSSALPTYRVCELARERVTVALSGDGGDENLAGYRRYWLHMLEERPRQLLPYGLRKPLFGTLGTLYPKMDWAPRFLRAKTTFQGLARNSVEAYFHSVSIFKKDMKQKLFSTGFQTDLQGYDAQQVFDRHASDANTDDPLSLIQYLDIKTYLVGDILTKVDRASMAHSLEVRVPLLDHHLVEWIATLPSDMKLKGSEGKYIFKKSLEGRLSDDILYRKKMGFAVPLGRWFREELKDKIRSSVLSERMKDSGYFDVNYLHHLVEQHQSGVRDYSASLWTLMMFDQFLARC